MTPTSSRFGRPWRVRNLVAIAAIAVVVAWAAGLRAQQRDARATPVTVGTGEISGIVWSGDATPRPISRAVVSISGGGLPAARSVITDDAGRFVFGKLPAGEFTIGAKKAAYLPTTHGSVKPGRPGSSIVLSAGQRQAISVTMFKGAVISGTLRDATGQPLPGVSVNAVDVRTASASDVSLMMQVETVTSDDRGMYRIYGLMPGEYYVVANPTSGGDGGIGTRSQTDMDAVIAGLAQRQNRTAPAGATSRVLAPLPVGNSVGYAPVFFPGTAIYTEAATIRVAAGEERVNVNFDVRHVKVASISGTISGDIASFGVVQVAIVIGGPRVTGALSTGGISSKPPNAQGEFEYGNLPPGSYRIIARARRGTPSGPPSGETVVISGRGGGSSGGGTPVAGTGVPAANVEQLFAVADVDVREQDVTGVALSLQPGGTMHGKLVFDVGAGPAPADFSGFRVALTLPGGSYMMSSGSTVVGNSYSLVPAVPVNADGTFQIIGIGPGPYAFTCQVPAALVKIWKLRTAVADGRDLLDGSIDGPNVQFTGVTVTLSDKTTELAGTLQSASGQPVSDYYVVAFSADRSQWRTGSRRNKSAKPGADGRYTFTDLPAGEYFVAALTDLDPLEWQTPAFLDQVVPAAIKVTVSEGEKKMLDLRIK